MSIIQKRQKSVWLWPDFIFKFTADGQKYERGLKHLHDFTRNVIKQRWSDYQQKKQELGENFEAEYFGEAKSARKHRLSFLGTLEFGFLKIVSKITKFVQKCTESSKLNVLVVCMVSGQLDYSEVHLESC